MIALNAVKSELFGEGGGAEVAVVGAARRPPGLARRRPRATRSGTTCASARTPRRRSRSPATSPTRRSRRAARGNRRHRQRLVPAGADAGRGRRAGRPSAIRPHASNVLMVAGKRSRSGHPLFVGGPQIGYFYPGLTLEMDLHGPGWTARGATSAPFPGYILIGRARGLRLDAHLGGRRHRRQLRRDALRRQRHEVPLQGQVPLDDALQRGQRSTGQAGHLQPHRARAGDRLRDGRRHARGDRRASAPATCSTAWTCCCSSGSRAARSATRATSSRPRRSRRRRSTRSTPTATRSRRSRPGGCRCAPRASIPGLPTDGRGNYEWKGFAARPRPTRTRSSAAACSTTGTTSRRAGSRPPTTSGRTARSSASTCSTATPTRSSATRSRRSPAR